MRGFEILMAPGFDIYIKNYEGLYGYNIGSEPVMVLDWVKAGLSGNTIENFTPITPQKYVCCNREYIFNRRELVILDMIPKIELKEKKVITIAQLGFVSPGSTFDYCVQQFNRRSEEYRIEVIDYAKYNLDGDMDRGAMLLNAAIAAGNIPDMFHWEVMGTNFPIYSYMEKGLFLDLYDVMDIDIVELARKPFEQNGKLYQLPMQIHFRTTVGKKANFPKTPLTPLELIDVFNSLESDQYLFLFDIKNQLINPRTILDFIDTKNRKVYFDSEDFIEFIKFVKEHGEVRALGRYSFDDYDIYRDDKVLLGTTSISSFDDIARFKYIFMEEFAFVGYPTLSDNGMYPMPMMSYGISSKTKYPEACWEFIKILLDDDLQYQIGIKQNKFPLTQNAMDKFIDYYLEIDYTIDDYKVELTREELENLLAYCTSSKAYNEMEYVTILNIINEEMSYDKTPEEIAKIIQSRVSIYINERY
ncbi:MAG: extracellular solute-binding protein, partial [Oscillospiraceae bacterium]|nr:extracellular solute-binding protein [Oscillospiraceae bacterium]